jgi:hypothetical protein
MISVLEKPLVETEIYNTTVLDEEHAHDLYIQEKLAEAEAYAANPDAVWLSDEEFWEGLE